VRKLLAILEFLEADEILWLSTQVEKIDNGRYNESLFHNRACEFLGRALSLPFHPRNQFWTWSGVLPLQVHASAN